MTASDPITFKQVRELDVNKLRNALLFGEDSVILPARRLLETWIGAGHTEHFLRRISEHPESLMPGKQYWRHFNDLLNTQKYTEARDLLITPGLNGALRGFPLTAQEERALERLGCHILEVNPAEILQTDTATMFDMVRSLRVDALRKYTAAHVWQTETGIAARNTIREIIGAEHAASFWQMVNAEPTKNIANLRIRWRELHQSLISGRYEHALHLLQFKKTRAQLGALFPLTADERDALIAVRQSIRERDRQANAEQAAIAIAKKEQERVVLRERIGQLQSLPPGKRWTALHKDAILRAALDQHAAWPHEWRNLFAAWREKKEEQKKQSTVRTAEQRLDRARVKAYACAVTPTEHLQAVMHDDQIELIFDSLQCGLKSEKMEDDLRHAVVSHFSRLLARPQDAHTEKGVLHLIIPRTKALLCGPNMERAEQSIKGYQFEPLPPYYVEDILHITTLERKKWTKDGRLPVVGYVTVHKKWVGDLTVAQYNPLFIRQITPELTTQWRQQDKDTTAQRRKQGIHKAKETRQTNDRLRDEARTMLDQRAKDAAIGLGSPAAYPVHYLAMLASIASRHAKEAQERGNREQVDLFYRAKEKAISAILKTVYARQSFVQAHQPKYQISCCARHFEEYREERHQCGDYPFMEWAEDNLRMLKKCPDCVVNEDNMYYAFFCVTVGPDSDKVTLHCPYGIGQRVGFSRYTTLPKADHSTEGWNESGFLFGRPSDDEEKMLFTSAWLTSEMDRVLEDLRHTDRKTHII
jgi:hypothetical protein